MHVFWNHGGNAILMFVCAIRMQGHTRERIIQRLWQILIKQTKVQYGEACQQQRRDFTPLIYQWMTLWVKQQFEHRSSIGPQIEVILCKYLW